MPQRPETGDAANPPERLTGNPNTWTCAACGDDFETAAAYRTHDCEA